MLPIEQNIQFADKFGDRLKLLQQWMIEKDNIKSKEIENKYFGE